MSFHPQTPQSPSQLSPGTSDTLPSLTTSMTSIPSTLPTPAHSVNGCTSQPYDMSHDLAVGDDSPQKRKRTLDDVGERDQKKIHLENTKLILEDLHLEVGEKYLLCQKPLSFPKYRTSGDLFEMFGLTKLANDMAREKPNGEKNTLRKSFKGQLKRLVIDGGYDTKKDEREENDPDGFFHMLYMPEDIWYANVVTGKDIRDGFSDTVTSSLPKAMAMLKGKIRKEHWDPYILGALEPSAGPLGDAPNQTGSAKATEPNTPAASTPAAQARPKAQGGQAQTLQGQDPLRPRRNIKKRSYGDSSFEGYGEGFPDDEAGVEAGYSTGEGDDRGGLKRRKKSAGTTQPFPSPMRQQNYGPGMVGA